MGRPFYKTRALAREMIEGGRCTTTGSTSKPSKIVELNATLTLRRNDERTVIVKAITEQRRPPARQSCCMKRLRKV